jgi:hypothetical protein
VSPLSEADIQALAQAMAPAVAGSIIKHLNAQPLQRRRRGSTADSLSYTEAARRLGISRNGALHDLIADHRIRTVTIAGHKRIPVSEIERILNNGTIYAAASRRRRAEAPPTAPKFNPDEWRR